MTTGDRDLIWVLTPCGRPEPKMVGAASRADALGILDLGIDRACAVEALTATTAAAAGAFGVRVPQPLDLSADDLPPDVCTVVLPVTRLDARWSEWAAARRDDGDVARVVAEVVSTDEALAAIEIGVDGLIAKGAEGAGRVGATGAFVLLQQVVDVVEARGGTSIPVWVLGGIGVHTAGAAIVGGARGVVVDSQLGLVRESSLPPTIQRAIAAMDGSETRVVAGHRVYHRPDLWVATDAGASTEDLDMAARLQGDTLTGEVAVPIGQDGCFASAFARRWHTTGRAVDGLRKAVDEHLAWAQRHRPLARHDTTVLGTEFPVAQGPMTRVSDQPEFAARVAEAGGLPFLALALLGGDEVRDLLSATRERLGANPWGVGILGFVPKELREEQLAVIREVRPPAVIIAGGRPSQAAPLESGGIATYLHVPGPGLLERFVRDGARRFVFEGFECGGHIGPRSSFVLWESQIDVLLEEGSLDGFSVLFAGGIHDARSAAMLSVLAAPLVDRGADVGVIMGTAYLFTAEAVESGAIGPVFQDQALACNRTSVLQSGPGHVTRCAQTPFVEQFHSARDRLAADGRSPNEIWAELESLNLGRLRLASKGLRRDGDAIVSVEEDEQRAEGLFMIGDVATLHHERTTIAELHDQVTRGANQWLDDVAITRMAEAPPPSAPLDIAIVGMSAIMPGAADLETYWANVLDGVDCVTEVPPERWNTEREYNPDYTHEAAARDPRVQSASKWGGFIPPVDFDALAYGIPPTSLAATEPAQLLALKVATDALVDAGYAVGDGGAEFPRDRTAVVFASAGGTEQALAYSLRCALPGYVGELPSELDEYLPVITEDSFPGMLTSVIAGRVANRLDLGGKNLTVDAACASSLAAADVACAELASGNADLVVCGSADLHNGLHDFQFFTSVHALSPTGRSRTFDASADGIALGEGVACVVLKRLSDARRDGDRVYAVIKAVAGASDGRHLGLTAPRQEGQERAMRRAYEAAGVDLASVGLVEAHGTGTVVGDRTELRALNRVFGDAAATGSITLGSVKSNIGHTKCSAGLAGMIKAAKAIYHGVRPPTLNVEHPNEAFEPTTSPFHFLDRARPWMTPERIAGVSAFGFGGTNFHAVLTGVTDDEPAPTGREQWPSELVVFRGTDDDVDRDLMDLLERLDGEPPLDTNTNLRLRDIAAASLLGDGPVRLAIIADDVADLRAKATAAADGRTVTGLHRAPVDRDDEAANGRVAMLFPGQGSQRPGMLSDLLVAFPRIRTVAEAGAPWLETMLPAAAFDPQSVGEQRAALTDTRVAQPALAIADLCMLGVLDVVGLAPDVVAGHSFGELVALCAAGTIDVPDLLAVASARAEAILAAAGADPGTMAAVSASRLEVAPIAEASGAVIANHNHPQQVVLSGPTKSMEKALALCKEAGLTAKKLEVACAFHSPVVAGAGERLAHVLESVEWRAQKIPVFANTTAAPYPENAEAAKALLAEQVGREVRFTEQIRSMYDAGVRTFVEVGPGRVLTSMVEKTLEGLAHVAVATDRPGTHGVTALLDALAQLSVAGVALDLEGLHRDRDSDPNRWHHPAARAAWTVNGHLVRQSADGQVVSGGLRPANEMPVLRMSGSDETDDAETASTEGSTSQHDQGGATVTNTPPAEGAARPPVNEVMLRYFDTVDRLTESSREALRMYLQGADGPSHTVANTQVPATEPQPIAEATVDAAPATNDTAVAVPVAAGDAEEGTAPADIIRQPEALLELLVEIVARRTGYPADMLDQDMDLEADLSIDSIKRLEVLGELSDATGIDEGDLEDMDDLMEELAAQKTLRTIVAFLVVQADRLTPPPPTDPPPNPASSAPAATPAALPADAVPDAEPTSPSKDSGVAGMSGTAPIPSTARHYSFELTELEGVVPRTGMPTGAVVSGTGNVAHELAAVLAERGVEVLRVESCATDAPVTDQLVMLCDLLDDAPPSVAGLFEALRRLRDEKAGEIVVVSGFGGGLGIDPPAPLVGDDPVPRGAGVRALVKTFALEHPERSFRLVDVSPVDAAPGVAALIADELDAADAPVEVGRDGTRRRVQRLRHLPRSSRAIDEIDVANLGLERDAVVLITGGARGVTSSLAVALAGRSGCAIELAGRSRLPVDAEPAELAECPDRKSLRHALAEQGERDPKAIEVEVDRLFAEREIRQTMALLAATSSGVTYHSVDVRDAAALTAVVEDIYARHGRLDGIVHGAGIGINQLIDDKSVEGFEAAYDTKVDALRTLLRAVDGELGFLVVFGSLVGPLGNRGQVDYAAANDALDAVVIANRDRARRAVVVDWGPWDPRTGMMSDQLARLMERGGIGMLEANDAIGCLLADLVETDLTQVAIVRAEPSIFDADTVTTSWPSEPVTELRRFSLDEFPETLDHCLMRQREGATNLRERLPAVAMTRQLALFAEIAGGFDPHREVTAIQQVRNFRWLDVSEPIDVEVSVAPVAHDALRIALGDYSKARVVLGSRGAAPRRTPRDLSAGREPTYTPEQLFSEHLMFHGPRFQGITHIGPIDDRGLRMVLEHLPTPGATLDNVGKAIAYWTMENRDWGDRALPVGVDGVRFFGDDPRVGDTLHLEVEITRSQRDEVRADAWVTNEDGEVWCEIRGWRTVVMHLEPRVDRHTRWPERSPVIDVGPDGLHLWPDTARSTIGREFVARRGLDDDDRRHFATLQPTAQRRFLCERLAAVGTLWQSVASAGGLEVFPNEFHFEPRREGLLLATCDRIPGTVWEVAVAASIDVGLAVAVERVDPRRPLEAPPVVLVRECTKDEDPDTITSAVVEDVRRLASGAEIRSLFDTTTSRSGGHLAIAFTPTGNLAATAGVGTLREGAHA